MIALREWSRLAEELQHERVRLGNRIRQQLWRYYPQLLEVSDDVTAEWLLELWTLAPTPAKAARLRATTLARLLQEHRIRRVDAERVLGLLRQPAITVAEGVSQSASVIRVSMVGLLKTDQPGIRKPGCRESGGFCEVRGATFGRRDADLIEAGLNEAAVGVCRDLWGLLSGSGWRGGAEAQGRWDRGERWSSILPEVNGASGGLRPFAAAGGVRRAVPARKGPAAAGGRCGRGSSRPLHGRVS